MATKRITPYLALVSLLVLVALPYPPTANAAPSRLSMSATDCLEAEAFFLVDIATLAEHVPDHYQAAEVFPGIGELMVTVTSCTDISINGKKGSPGILGKAGIYIEPPAATPSDFDYYGLWQVGNVAALTKGLSKLGLRAPVIKDAEFSSTTNGFDAETFIPFGDDAHRFSLAAPAPVGLFVGYNSTFWYDTPKGTISLVHSTSPSYRSGGGLFETTEDSVVADIIGASVRPADIATIAQIDSLSTTVTRHAPVPHGH